LSIAKTSATKGKKVTAKVKVTGAGFTPTGTVQIKDGSKVLKTFAVSGATRSVSVTMKSTGRRSIKAYYLGSGTASPSKSSTDKVRVTRKK
ncbi:MAG: Ig-like domain-containing protein, partial [Aeromicrobium sp.]